MDDAKRAVAEQILHRHEDRCAAECELNPGCEELIEWLHSRNVKLAVVTRNSLKSASTVFARHNIRIDTLITRDDGVFKPAPDPLLLACRRLEVPPADTWMIGDGQYDVEAGHAARMRTIWLSHGQPREFSAVPDHEVRDLLDLHQQFQQCRGARV
jgi:phosphoglycolate phosphatase